MLGPGPRQTGNGPVVLLVDLEVGPGPDAGGVGLARLITSSVLTERAGYKAIMRFLGIGVPGTRDLIWILYRS